jgi:hypothetical protein
MWALSYALLILVWFLYSIAFFVMWFLTGWPYALFGAGVGISTVGNLIWNVVKDYL